MAPLELRTQRLRLVAATPDLCLLSDSALGRALGGEVASGWPPAEMADALDAWTEELTRDPSLSGWVSWYWLVRRLDGDQLLGCGGFKGRPDAQGIVEIGYAVCDEHRQRGYAAEAVAALCRWALSHSPVRRIDAETLPHLDASIALLSRLGFRRLPSTDPPVLRFGLSKPL